MQPPRYYLEEGVTALRRGPDHLPRRLTPRAFDDLHSSLDHHETTRQWEDKFGWDRYRERDRDHAEYRSNLEKTRKIRESARLNSALVFRHSGWAKTRDRVSAALHEVFTERSTPHRFDCCGSKVIVCREKDNPSGYALLGNYCKNRWCQPCGNSRSQTLARAYHTHLRGKKLRFITLTLKSDTESLDELIDKLYTSFSKLQRTKLWKSCVTGGVGFLETKFSHRNERWHPHFHILVEGKFIPQKALSQAWNTITTDSYVVDVRAAKDEKEAIKYITKYATKPALSTISHRHDLLTEAIRALHGKRMMIRFGSFRKFDLKSESRIDVLLPIMSLSNLLKSVSERRPTAVAILTFLTCGERPP